METKQENIISKAKEKLKKNITEIENRTDISDDEKVTLIIKTFSAGCAAVAVQPIPFADIFVLTPIQAYMGTRIGAIRGVPVNEGKATEILKELAGIVGLGLLAQQLVIGAYKFIPYWGMITTIPIVYGLTYAIGRVMDAYFIQKRKKEKIDPEILRTLWKEELKKGKNIGKDEADDIKDRKDEYSH